MQTGNISKRYIFLLVTELVNYQYQRFMTYRIKHKWGTNES